MGTRLNSATCHLELQISWAVYLLTNQSNTNQLQMSLKFIQLKGVYDYFLQCEMLRINCEWKHEHLLKKKHNKLSAHDHGTGSIVNNELVLPRYSKSICQNVLMFRSIKLWNVSLNGIKQPANLTRLIKYLKRLYWILQITLSDKSKWFQLNFILKIFK